MLALSCDLEPDPLPTEEAARDADAGMEEAATPPMVQLLYDYAFLPDVQYRQQRVRMLLWLVHMELSEYQLRVLAEAWTTAETERGRIDEAQREIVAQYEPELGAVYDQVWERLRSGASIDDPELLALAEPLTEARIHKEQERELLALRFQGVEAVNAAQKDFLRSLSPQQEAKVADASFFLRHKLDPYANPGDFNALIGTVFTPGDYATLKRGSFDPETDHLDLAGLWSDPGDPDREKGVFPDVQRELVVFMILQEPALPEAIEAALSRSSPPAP